MFRKEQSEIGWMKWDLNTKVKFEDNNGHILYPYFKNN